MSIKTNDNFVSKKSAIYSYVTDQKKESVGKIHSAELLHMDLDKIKETFGEKIANGDVGTIYQVNCDSPRVYKVISINKFNSGDEIRISKIAGKLGVGPCFCSAFVTEQKSSKYVVIEMEDAGKSLGKWAESLAESSEIHTKEKEVAPEEKEEEGSSDEQAMREMIKKFLEKMKAESGFIVTEIPQKKKLSLEETINKLYKNPEDFYYELFNKIKILTENNIAYGDTHMGNIMPRCNTDKGLQLIDFDAAEITSSKAEAKNRSMASLYNQVLFQDFKKIEGLSDKSLSLIQWFETN